ncbi:PepSY-associated TM helix domain-containing protein [Marinicrinis sediminis]|uniref:PepSY-associated TM helix domain-containing protein n=1 Tax=Marinicrinis sediminis TaxID=1652465 RepID=A0ABW5RF98_9BACL
MNEEINPSRPASSAQGQTENKAEKTTERRNEHQNEQQTEHKIEKKKSPLYASVWRWHFYAGLIFTPFLLILAISGGIYLFKDEVENYMHHDQYFVSPQTVTEEKLPPSDMVEKVQAGHPGAVVISMTQYDNPERSVKMGLIEQGQMSFAFINPYNGELSGKLSSDDMLMNQVRDLHSQLLVGGTWANRLVELAAGWALILLLTGLYIWWPRNKGGIWGTLLPRFRARGRTFWRDLHAVPAFWLSAGLLLLILTGLPWSGVMGEQIQKFSTSTNTGYPAFALSFGEKPQSVTYTKDVAQDIPWATEKLPVPTSDDTKGLIPLGINEVQHLVDSQSIDKPYTLSFPSGASGVYTVATTGQHPTDLTTIHLDQYSGTVLTDVRFADLGITAQAISLGIALHEGRLFGLPNQLLGLLVCAGLVLMIISAIVMWLKRRPAGKLGAPSKPASPRPVKQTIVVWAITLILGILMPLVGLSIVAVLLLDLLVIRRIKALKSWFSA